MKINFDSLVPVYVQIAEAIEDDIINGTLIEGSPAYSQLVNARGLNVNPATAAKGINVLVAKGILEKQRGTSMVVAHGALDTLLSQRRENGFNQLVLNLVAEAKKIGLLEAEVVAKIGDCYKNLGLGLEDKV